MVKTSNKSKNKMVPQMMPAMPVAANGNNDAKMLMMLKKLLIIILMLTSIRKVMPIEAKDLQREKEISSLVLLTNKLLIK